MGYRKSIAAHPYDRQVCCLDVFGVCVLLVLADAIVQANYCGVSACRLCVYVCVNACMCVCTYVCM